MNPKLETSPQNSVESAVMDRYRAGAQQREEALCCPVSYNPELLKIIPQEILDKDYGCGDPSPYVQEGDTVLDLGSGGGKLCYIASQLAGPQGRVIGVDMTPDMLALAEKHKPAVASALGYSNVEFRKGKIQDLALDLADSETYLQRHPVKDLDSLRLFESHVKQQKAEKPLVADDSVDLIISNCVLNLVEEKEKEQLFSEMFRVLKKGGRIAISDIVCDEDVPAHMMKDADLWSGCLSGALREDRFLEALARRGFYGLEISKRDESPWQVVEGLEFRSLTVTAYKGKEGPCLETQQAVIYKGPFSQVRDDDGHIFYRGQRMAVCEKTFQIMGKAPYQSHFEPVPSRVPQDPSQAGLFNCQGPQIRNPKATKGQDYKDTIAPCSEDGSCC